MHAQQNPSPTGPTSAADRKFCRGDVAIDASIRAFGGVKTRIMVIDISTTGFRMECLTYMSNHQVIFLTMPGFQQMEARIVWQTEWMYGCEFARPLHAAVYDHIRNAHPSLEKVSTETDGFTYGAAAGLQWAGASTRTGSDASNFGDVAVLE